MKNRYPKALSSFYDSYDRFYLSLCHFLLLPSFVVLLLYLTGTYEEFTYVAFEKAKAVFENLLCGFTLSISFFLLLRYARMAGGKH